MKRPHGDAFLKMAHHDAPHPDHIVGEGLDPYSLCRCAAFHQTGGSRPCRIKPPLNREGARRRRGGGFLLLNHKELSIQRETPTALRAEPPFQGGRFSSTNPKLSFP